MIKKYTKKDGSVAYKFQVYLGIDPKTGKKRYTTRRGFKTEKDAKLAKARLELSAANGSYRPETNQTFEDITTAWLKQYKSTVKPSTYLRVECIFRKNILPAFGKLKISKIKPLYCQSVIDEWKEQLSTYSALKSYTSRVFDFAIRMEIIDTNPMKATSFSRTVKQKEKKVKFFSKKTLQSFLETVEKDSISIMAYPALRLLAFSGMRKGELSALTWNDVDFAKRSAAITKTVSRGEDSRLTISTTKTSESNRIISLDNKTLDILKKWKIEQQKHFIKNGINTLNKDQLIFHNATSHDSIMHADTINRWIKYYARNYGFDDIGPHGFRHTHCSLLFEAGASVKEVQARLGHKDMNTTMNIYYHVTENAMDKTAELFAKYANF